MGRWLAVMPGRAATSTWPCRCARAGICSARPVYTISPGTVPISAVRAARSAYSVGSEFDSDVALKVPVLDEDGLRGVTSNPAIVEKAIAGSNDYEADLKALERH